MRDQLFVQRGGEGVASWVRLVAMFGALALFLTTLAIAPSPARADEDQTVDAPQEQVVADLPGTEEISTSEVVPPGIETFEDIPVLDESNDPFFPETDVLDNGLFGPSQEPRAGPVVNADIDVTVDSITSADKDSKTLQVGDDASIKGTWDSLLADPIDGTKFWVTFPTAVLDDLEVKSPTSGISEVISNGEVIGFEVDTELLGESGEWEVAAKVVAATSDTALNFLTSASPQDISVSLPGEEGIVGSASKDRDFSTLSGDGILVDNIVIENDDENGKQLQPGQTAKISGTWAAPDSATGGETFVVEIPAVFGITPIVEFALVGADGDVYGTCNVSQSENTLTCVLSDTVDGQNDVHGQWDLWVTADERTTEEEVDFIIDGGEPVSVRLPGENGGIGRITPIPTEPSKSGSKLGQQGVRWTVDIPGVYLAENNIPNPAIFVDTPTGGQQVVTDSGELQFYDEVNVSLTPQNVRELEGGAVVFGDQNAEGAFDITLNPGEEWDPFKVYRIQYQTKTDELLDPGTALTNNIGIGEGPGVGGSSLYPTWKTRRQVDRSYQAIEWTILAPAREAVDGVLTITDTFADSALPHSALEPKTLESLSVVGPHGDVAGDLRITDPKNITITFPVSAADEDANAVYTVKYTTYYDGTDEYPVGTLYRVASASKMRPKLAQLKLKPMCKPQGGVAQRTAS